MELETTLTSLSLKPVSEKSSVNAAEKDYVVRELSIADIYSLKSCQVSGEYLTVIDLSHIGICMLPKFTKQLQFCTELRLAGNKLKGPVSWLVQLKRLQCLDLSYNQLSEVADVCGSVSTLHDVNLSHNCLTEFPEWVLMLENVKNLNLGFNPLSKLCHTHCKGAKWYQVEVCHLEMLNLVSLPECLQRAYYLRELYLGSVSNTEVKPLCDNNSFWNIPKQLPHSLEVLELSHVNISSLEHDWQAISNLRKLVARGNV